VNDSYLRIEEGGMRAWLFLMPPRKNEKPYTYEEIEAFLQLQNVRFGLHRSNLMAMSKKGVYKREIVVAHGKEPVDGIDGYFEYCFEVSTKAPEVREDGTVDYSAVNRLVNVRVGDKLATYIGAIQGEDGSDVSGNPIKAKIGKDIPALRGAHVSRRDTENEYFAEREGKVEIRDGKIDIQNTHEIFDDVNLNVGKIEFFGDVVINGSVESGVTIRAGRNIEVRGSVEAASLFAGGDVILQRGIQGQQKARISARGSVFAKFIEQTIVNAGGDVTADSIMNSRITADGKVTLTGKRGMLVGGHTHALLGVLTSQIGNEAETRTVVHVGCEAEVVEKGISLKKREVQIRNMLEEMTEEMEESKKKAALYGDKQQKVMEITAAKSIAQQKQLQQELAVLQDEQTEIKELIAKGKASTVKVDGNVYRGSVICIAQLQMPIEKNTMFMEYAIQGGLIVGHVIIR
jgi:uncharacterized protein (DUF342 family)